MVAIGCAPTSQSLAYGTMRAEPEMRCVRSIWLLPPDALLTELNVRCKKLAIENGTPCALPHVTLIGDSGHMDEKEARRRLRLLQGSGKVPCRFRGEVTAGRDADGKTPWNQTCVAIVEETSELVNAHKLARRVFLGEEGPGWAPPLLLPHLSLAYGTDTSVCTGQILPPAFVAHHAALVDCTPANLDGVSSWRVLEKVTLEDPASTD